MNAELSRLLVDAGVPPGFGWRDVVMVQNYVPVPSPVVSTDPRAWIGGFNLTVLEDGKPRYFCKCRVRAGTLEAETRTQSLVAGTRPHGLSVPAVRTARSDRIAVQVGPFLGGTPCEGVIAKLSTRAYLKTLRTVVDGAAEIASLAAGGSGPIPPISLEAVAAPAMEWLAGTRALDNDGFIALLAALRAAGSVPARPQHGDLWGRNLLLREGTYWLVDFETYGDTQVPLYDDVHLLWTSSRLRGRSPARQLTRVAGTDLEARECRLLLGERAAAEGIAPAQLDGILAFYLVEMVGMLHRRAGERWIAPYLDDLRQVSRALAAGTHGLLT